MGPPRADDRDMGLWTGPVVLAEWLTVSAVTTLVWTAVSRRRLRAARRQDGPGA